MKAFINPIFELSGQIMLMSANVKLLILGKVCAVHWRVSSNVGHHQYYGGFYQYSGRCLVLLKDTISTMFLEYLRYIGVGPVWETISTVRDTSSILEGV